MAKNHIKIVRMLLERQEEELNISKISTYLNIDYKAVYNLIQDLEERLNCR